MPPRKLQKLSTSQRTLTSLFGQSDTNKDTIQTTECSAQEAGDTVTKHKIRKFQSSWLTTHRSWLTYDREEDFMFCTLCTENGKRNGMTQDAKCRNFQNTTLIRHINHDDHKLSIQAPKLRDDLQVATSHIHEKQDKAAVALMKSVHWLASENIPLTKFKSFVEFLHEFETKDIQMLKEGKIHYDSPTTATDLLTSMSDVIEDDLQIKMEKSPFVTVLADESTDISNHKRLVIYCQIVLDMVPSTHFVTNIECTDTTGKGIAREILDQLKKRGIPPEKIMSLGSDGASAMTGKYNGAAAIIKRQNPHCVNIHCIAHKLALCTSQAASGIQHLKDHQQVLTDLFYYFRASSKRASRIQEIQKILEDPKLTYKEIHSVRWLSYFEALSCVYLTLDSLLTYLSEFGTTSDHIANGLKKKVGSQKFISITYMMMDAMAPVTALSQFFQKENIDVALVKVKLDCCVKELLKVKSMETGHLKKLSEDLKNENFKEDHHIQKTPDFNLQSLVDTFITALVDNISSRFPSDDLLASFGILSMRPISFLNGQQLDDYGQKEIDKLCQHYGEDQTMTWKEDGKTLHKTTPPIINIEQTIKEWALLKKVVLAQHYPRDSSCELWKLIYIYHAQDFPNMVKLGQLALTLAVHTAGCERGFSVQNQTLTASRNRMTVQKQDRLMRVKLGPSRKAFKFEASLNKWKTAKERRLYELKQYK